MFSACWMSAIVNLDVTSYVSTGVWIPYDSTGVVPALAGGEVMVAPIPAGSWTNSDQEDQAGVATGGTATGCCHCTLRTDLDSAGALCALGAGRAGPYARTGPLDTDEAAGLQRSHRLRNTETGC